ncbi:hypothetical protein SH528x_003029 [Novipirellula sp. SH528]|uniref:hypothetical protein n=1 Tax=Novipirellula sp. SH528 TaxID=3454466 RepID=UPI003F9F7927
MNRENATFASSNVDGDWEHDACIHYCGFDWPMVADGFTEAANVLAYKAQEQSHFLDSLIYPIAFNFRHAVELRLKIACFRANAIYRTVKLPPSGHDLSKLWAQLKPDVIKRFANDPDYPRIAEIEDILGDLVDFDATSTNFRYPTDRKGLTSLPGVTNINIPRLQDRLNLLLNLLQTIGDVFDSDWDALNG